MHPDFAGHNVLGTVIFHNVAIFGREVLEEPMTTNGGLYSAVYSFSGYGE